MASHGSPWTGVTREHGEAIQTALKCPRPAGEGRPTGGSPSGGIISMDRKPDFGHQEFYQEGTWMTRHCVKFPASWTLDMNAVFCVSVCMHLERGESIGLRNFFKFSKGPVD